MADADGWIDTPPAWVSPATVAADVVLVRAGGVLASVGSVCVYPQGFVFYLAIGLDPQHAVGWRSRGTRGRLLGFHARTPAEQESAARVAVTFPGGKSADSLASMSGVDTPGEPVLRFAGGESVILANAPVLRSESRWWVSPLPPPGPVEFRLFLPGAAGPSGSASMDAAAIIAAAGRSQTLWPPGEPEGPL